jgi:ABC-type glycerol-3-phosphate transport system substrate-binding protein
VLKLNLIKTMRKVFALLTLAGLLSVASCGGSTEGTTDSTAGDSTSTMTPASEDTTKTMDSTMSDTTKKM